MSCVSVVWVHFLVSVGGSFVCFFNAGLGMDGGGGIGCIDGDEGVSFVCDGSNM